jgi:hypothetical protein
VGRSGRPDAADAASARPSKLSREYPKCSVESDNACSAPHPLRHTRCAALAHHLAHELQVGAADAAAGGGGAGAAPVLLGRWDGEKIVPLGDDAQARVRKTTR